MTAINPPWWVWPARVAGVMCLATSVLLPVWYICQQSIAAMPKEQVVSLRELRPTMLLLPTGEFQMGRASNDTIVDPAKLYEDELPQHQVEITRAYAVSETEVTQGQYQAVMGTNPSRFVGKEDSARRPVENVSWYEAVEYCNKLSEREGLAKCYEVEGEVVKWPQGVDCKGYRLPTEAEWEYAARAEEGTVYAGSNKAEDVAWFAENSKGETHEVKSKERLPNQWGLYDLSGNVWEWVWDEYGPYKAESSKNPVGPLLGGSQRVNRGGSWSYDAGGVRVASRDRNAPDYRNRNLGFRLVRSYP